MSPAVRRWQVPERPPHGRSACGLTSPPPWPGGYHGPRWRRHRHRCSRSPAAPRASVRSDRVPRRCAGAGSSDAHLQTGARLARRERRRFGGTDSLRSTSSGGGRRPPAGRPCRRARETRVATRAGHPPRQAAAGPWQSFRPIERRGGWAVERRAFSMDAAAADGGGGGSSGVGGETPEDSRAPRAPPPTAPPSTAADSCGRGPRRAPGGGAAAEKAAPGCVVNSTRPSDRRPAARAPAHAARAVSRWPTAFTTRKSSEPLDSARLRVHRRSGSSAMGSS